MRVAVTGATGNVGTALVRLLAEDDRITSIVGIARRRPQLDLPKVTWVEADVANDDLAPHFAGAEAVVHLAWLFQPTHRPLVTWDANAVGSVRVFAAVAAAGVGALIYASSVGAYSPAPPDDHRVAETWPTHSTPFAAYGREKAYVERVLDAFVLRNPGIRVVRMRPGFIFQQRSATQQRRLFAGPFVPGRLVQPGRLPRLPLPRGLRFQALHSEDAAHAYRLAVVNEVEGPFNLVAEPVIDAGVLGELLATKPLALPRPLVVGAVDLAWRTHLIPADPGLLKLFLSLPLLDAERARTELGWEPRHRATEAIHAFISGLAAGAGGETPPLAPDDPVHRLREMTTGVGIAP